MKFLLIALFLFTACSQPTQKHCPKVHQTIEQQDPEFKYGPDADQTTINMTSYEEAQYWKRKMGNRLSKIKQLYQKADWVDAAHQTRFFDNLQATQKAFEGYLKAQVELQYPKLEEEEWWGSGIPPCINKIYTEHYKRRYMELELWIKGSPDGDMCGGSALTQYELEQIKNK